MPSRCGRALPEEWRQCLSLKCGNENERDGSSPIAGQSASNLRTLLLQRSTAVVLRTQRCSACHISSNRTQGGLSENAEHLALRLCYAAVGG